MALPPALVAAVFVVAVIAALVVMAYISWNGSKPSEFFLETVNETYDMQLATAEINAYYDLKERLQSKFLSGAGSTQEKETSDSAINSEGDEMSPEERWAQSMSDDQRKVLQHALMRRLVGCIGKLDQVQRDKPGNWKLWRGKLVSEKYWDSLCDAERLVSEEIDSCINEAHEIAPGWGEHIFPQAVQCWRAQKSQEMEKKSQKKAVEQQKKQKEKEQRRKEVEERMKVEDKERQERLAEKAMQSLLIEEEKKTSKTKVRAKAPVSGSKPKVKKK